MILATLIVCGAVVTLYLRRRHAKNVLAGRDAAKPTYTTTPPTRTVGSRKTEVL